MAFIAHFITLIYKNFLRWKRSWKGSLCELLIPIGIVLLLKLAYDPTLIEETEMYSYLPDDIYSLTTLDDEVNDWPEDEY